MTVREEKIYHFGVSPERLFEILTLEEFYQARGKAHNALSTEVREVRRTPEQLVYDVLTTNYAWGLTGVDKSKTMTMITRYEWNLTDRTAVWRYTGAFSEHAEVWGNVKIQPEGAGSKLLSDFHLNIKIPLLGFQIERLVMMEVAKGWSAYENVIRDLIRNRPKAT